MCRPAGCWHKTVQVLFSLHKQFMSLFCVYKLVIGLHILYIGNFKPSQHLHLHIQHLHIHLSKFILLYLIYFFQDMVNFRSWNLLIFSYICLFPLQTLIFPYVVRPKHRPIINILLFTGSPFTHMTHTLVFSEDLLTFFVCLHLFLCTVYRQIMGLFHRALDSYLLSLNLIVCIYSNIFYFIFKN